MWYTRKTASNSMKVDKPVQCYGKSNLNFIRRLNQHIFIGKICNNMKENESIKKIGKSDVYRLKSLATAGQPTASSQH
jgi:hypothetical protein